MYLIMAYLRAAALKRRVFPMVGLVGAADLRRITNELKVLMEREDRYRRMMAERYGVRPRMLNDFHNVSRETLEPRR